MSSSSAPILGLTTVAAKVDNIEKQLNPLESQDFANVTIKNTLQSKEDKLRQDLHNIESLYKQGMAQSNISISTTNDILCNITKIVQYSVTFIEKNGTGIAKMLLTDLTSEFKLSTCISLIEQVIDGAFPNNQIMAYVEHFVSLLFPKTVTAATESPAVMTDSTDKISIKARNSIKRSARYIMKKSGCC